MALFDNLFGDKAGGKRELTAQEAFAGILFAAADSDGHIAEAELASLRFSLGRMRLFSDLTDFRWQAIADLFLRVLKHDGPQKVFELCCAALPGELRECAFANVCDLLFADGFVEDEEQQFLEHVQKSLELDSDTALNIVEVLTIKNKG
jgi:hypothetical protein